MTPILTRHSNCIALHVGQQGVCSAEEEALALLCLKNPQLNFLRYKNTFNRATFNVWTLNEINQLPKFTASEAEKYIDQQDMLVEYRQIHK